MILNLSKQTLAELNANWTAQEIAQQPKIWRSVQAQVAQHKTASAFLEPLITQAKQGQLRIIFTGAGTSAFIGETVACLLSEKLGCVIEAIASTQIVSNPQQYLFADKPTLLVSFARSGNSPESVATADLVNQLVKKAYHLVITNNAEGALFTKFSQNPTACCLVLPQETHDQSFAMTSSASSMMMAALTLFAPNDFNAEWVEQTAQATETLLSHELIQIQRLASQAVERVIYLGSGHLKSVAQEMSLKLLELTAGERLGLFDSPLGFRHGPKSVINKEALVFVMLSGNAYSERYEQDLFNELQQEAKAKKVYLLGGASGQILTEICQLDPAARLFVYLVFGQLYAFYSALHLHYSPDNPCPSGEVNRVVKGVTIYPFSN